MLRLFSKCPNRRPAALLPLALLSLTTACGQNPPATAPAPPGIVRDSATGRADLPWLRQQLDSSATLRRHMVGVALADASTGEALFGYNEARYFTPASTMKLLSLYAGLTLLPDSLPSLRYFSRGDTLFFQGTEATNKSFGVSLSLLQEAHEATLSLKRGTVGQEVMYFETGQGSALSANAHHGLDQQTCEARAYAVARRFRPLLVNTVVGFIGPEYLYDGKQIIRAALEDHFCGKLLGLPMGVDVCYTNHAEADQDDMDTLLTLLGVAGCSYIMGIPGADDIMLGYQSTSFHDALYLRRVLSLQPAPEFAAWLAQQGIFDEAGRQLPASAMAGRLGALPLGLP